MGPLPESQQVRLNIGDQFSKCYEAGALPNQEKNNVELASVEHWIVVIGCPVNLDRDQWSNFFSKSFDSH